jgi:hypothetical protein
MTQQSDEAMGLLLPNDVVAPIDAPSRGSSWATARHAPRPKVHDIRLKTCLFGQDLGYSGASPYRRHGLGALDSNS